MNFKFVYWLLWTFVFLGLLWMFLPHAFHNTITNDTATEHITHILQGLIPVLLSLAVLIYLERNGKFNSAKF
ncbi:hypothetical protein HY448_00195 [Candidatus Pacearchaeota archaeon]|nr:hypothetical protein [Candidatus Pacearchaeota archaeon]